MTHRTSPVPVVDLDALPDDLAADATIFIRISGPPVRPPAHAAPPPPPAPRLLPPTRAPVPTPFRVQSAPAPPPRSVAAGDPVLWATVGAAFFLCVIGLAGAVALQRGASSGPGTSELPPEPLGRGVAMASAGDTGDWQDEPADPVAPQAAPERVVAPAVVAVASPPSRPVVADLTVSLSDPRGITRMAVSCNSGFQGLSGYNTHPLVVADVPTHEPCTVHFRGASPYRYHGARGGQSLSCAFGAGVVTCR